MPIALAKIALWLDAPPNVVQMPLTNAGLSFAVSEGVKSLATRIVF